MDVGSFKNLNKEAARIAVKDAAKNSLLNMWGGEKTTLKDNAAEIFANTFTEKFSDLFIDQLSQNIVDLIQSAGIEGSLKSENPMAQGEFAIAALIPTSGSTSGVNTLKIKCM